MSAPKIALLAVLAFAPSIIADDPLPRGAVARLGSSLWRGVARGYSDAPFEFTSDGKSIVFLSPERTIIWLDAETGRVTRRLRGPAPFSNFSLTPDAKTLLTVDERTRGGMMFVPLPDPPDPRGLRAWDVDGEPKQKWFLENETGQIVVGARHVAVFGGHKLSLFDVRIGKSVWSNPSDDDLRMTSTHAFTSDSKSIVAFAGGDKVRPVVAWDVATGERRHVANLNSPDSFGFTLSADGWMAASIEHGVVRLWDLRAKKELTALTGHERGAVHKAIFAEKGKTVVSSGIDDTIRWWDSATGKELGRIKTARTANHMRLSPDGKTLAVVYLWENVLRRFDLATGRELPTPDGHFAAVTFLAFTADGKSLVSTSADYALMIWDPATGKERRRFAGETFGQFGAAAISPDGQIFANANGLSKDPVRLWDLSTSESIREIAAATGNVDAIAFAPDGKSLAVLRCRFSPDDPAPSVQLWDLAGKELWRADAQLNSKFHGQYCDYLKFAADGKRLWAATYPLPCAWDVATGRVVARSEEQLRTIAVSPDGRMIAGLGATESGKTEIRVIEAASGKVRLRFGRGPSPDPLNNRPVPPLAFSPDGRRIAATDRSAVVVWDIRTGKEVRRYEGHNRDVRVLAYSPDGKILASGSDDSTIMLWGTGDE